IWDLVVEEGKASRLCIRVETVTHRRRRIILGRRTLVERRLKDLPVRKVLWMKSCHPVRGRRKVCAIAVVQICLPSKSYLAQVIHVLRNARFLLHADQCNYIKLGDSSSA